MGMPKDKTKGDKKTEEKKKERKEICFWVGKEQNLPTPNDSVYSSIHFKYFNEVAIHSDGHGGPSPK